jgi:cytochrome c55X
LARPSVSSGGKGIYMSGVRFVFVVLALSAAGAATALEPARQAELLHLLRHDCGSCHGMTLKGGLGPALLPAALDGKPDALLIDTILEGRPGTAMPPWQQQLTEDEAAWLVERLKAGVE